MSDDIAYTIRLKPELMNSIAERAKLKKTSKSKVIQELLTMAIELNPVADEWLHNFAKTQQLRPSLVASNALIDFQARVAAERAIFDTGDRALKQFQHTPNGTLTGAELYDYLTGQYIDFFSNLKLQMLRDADVEIDAETLGMDEEKISEELVEVMKIIKRFAPELGLEVQTVTSSFWYGDDEPRSYGVRLKNGRSVRIYVEDGWTEDSVKESFKSKANKI